MNGPVMVDYGKNPKAKANTQPVANNTPQPPQKLGTETEPNVTKSLPNPLELNGLGLSEEAIKSYKELMLTLTSMRVGLSQVVADGIASVLSTEQQTKITSAINEAFNVAPDMAGKEVIKGAIILGVAKTMDMIRTQGPVMVAEMGLAFDTMLGALDTLVLGKNVKEEEERQKALEAQRELERQLQLQNAQKEIEKNIQSIASAVKNDKTLQESFATIQNKWNSQISDATKILTCLAESTTLGLCTKQFLSKDLSKDAYESILKDVALGKNINQVVEAVVKNEREDAIQKNIEAVKEQKLTEEQQQLLEETKKKLLEKGVSEERTNQIVKDIERTLTNPEKINQGKYATCVACVAINSAVYGGKGDTLIKLFNDQLDASPSLIDALKGEYGTSAFASGRPKMFGGALQAALMSSVSEGGVFTNKGEVQVTGANGKTCLISGLTDKQIAMLHKNLNLGVEAKVIDAETLKGNPPSEETFKENIKKLLAENPGGLNVKLRWGEGMHTFHMVNIVGFDDKGNFIIKNSQDPVLANRTYNQSGFETMNSLELMERMQFTIVENSADLSYTECSEITEGFVIEGENQDTYQPYSDDVARIESMSPEELAELYRQKQEEAPEPEGAVTYCQTVGEIEREKARTRNEASKGSNSK